MTFRRESGYRRCWIGLLLALTLALPAHANDPEDGSLQFELPDPRGKLRSLAEFNEAELVVVAFLGTECPLAKIYAPRLQNLADRYAEQKVQFIAIGPNVQDTAQELGQFAHRHSLSFPILKDPDLSVTDRFGATRTPEVFLLSRNRTIVYRGRIDDQFGVGYARPTATESFLNDAIRASLENRTVKNAEQPAVGCLIGRPVKNSEIEHSVTFADIAPLVERHCLECHREGQIGPFALANYDDVAAWAPTMEEVIREKRMPPWHASSDYGEFANARGLTSEETELFYQWVAAGTPEGPTRGPLVTESRQSEWSLAKEPDLVVAMRDRPFTVPAESTVEYQYFVVDPGFKEDKWVSATEILPGNRSVVHHALVFIRPPRFDRTQGNGWLAGYVPGQILQPTPPGHARRIPAGSKLIFQMHYTPTGTPQQDITRLGLVFADPKEVTHQRISLIALNQTFEIPPEDDAFPVTKDVTSFPEDATLWAIAPHMHVRGKAFRVDIEENGKTTTLLDVPRYDFNWQHVYALKKPIALRPGMRLQCRGVFDNSDGNLANPDPSATVYWGDQTWEEMMMASFVLAVPRKTSDQASAGKLSPEVLKQARSYIARFDRDGDGVLHRREVPDVTKTFAFGRFDADNNGQVDEQEVARVIAGDS